MNGPIEKFKSALGLNKKKYKRGDKKKKTRSVNYRDYRGPMGVVDDAQKTK